MSRPMETAGILGKNSLLTGGLVRTVLALVVCASVAEAAGVEAESSNNRARDEVGWWGSTVRGGAESRDRYSSAGGQVTYQF